MIGPNAMTPIKTASRCQIWVSESIQPRIWPKISVDHVFA
jgi:hypothetical protein